jgi:hypothetical protein
MILFAYNFYFTLLYDCPVSANPLPQPIVCATVVPFGDSFLLVGGITTGFSHLSTIYCYNPDEDSWTLFTGGMKSGTIGGIAMLVPRNMFKNE